MEAVAVEAEIEEAAAVGVVSAVVEVLEAEAVEEETVVAAVDLGEVVVAEVIEVEEVAVVAVADVEAVVAASREAKTSSLNPIATRVFSLPEAKKMR